MKRTVLFTGLALIVLANIIMMYYAPFGMRGEGFQNNMQANNTPMNNMEANMQANNMPMNNMPMNNMQKKEGFSSYNSGEAGGAKATYEPIGQYDGIKLSTGNSVSSWRYTAPNEPLTGAEFVPGDDALFMFKNNQCKPECCGASFSCGGGCVCTTPQQRQYIAERGGNRTEPEDSA
jgi:hypothetical protein